jgi:hypothetical protein
MKDAVDVDLLFLAHLPHLPPLLAQIISTGPNALSTVKRVILSEVWCYAGPLA